MTNYKQLCADLVAWAEKASAHYYSEPGVLIRARTALAEPEPPSLKELVERARTALAEPEPEGPTDEEIMALMPQQMHEDLAAATRAMAEQAGTDSTRAKGMMRIILNGHVVDHARAVLARWGNHVLQPVPVSERLPEPEDCNDEGEVWAWRRFSFFSLEKDIDNGDFWRLAYHKWLEGEDCGFTHWLPAHALPLPTHA